MNNFNKFAKHLKDSISDVFLGARIFHDKGFDVNVHSTTLAPSAEDWENFTDSGDLTISCRAEIKRINKYWTCLNDFPFEHGIVMNKAAFDRANPKPKFVVLINRDATHYMLMDCTRYFEQFEVRDIPDKRYGENYKQLTYLCRKECFIYGKI